MSNFSPSDDDSMEVDVDPSEVDSTSYRDSFVHRIDQSWNNDDNSNVQFINQEVIDSFRS